MEIIYFSTLLIFINLIFIKFYTQIGKFYNLYDYPNERRKIHTSPVPLLGGLFFFLNFILYFIFEIFFNNNSFFYEIYLNTNRQISIFIFCFICIFAVGFIDDKIKLSPITKLILISSICYAFFSSNEKMILNYLEISILNMIVDLFELGLIFSILCVVFYINSINMMDGINLLVALYIISISIILIFFNVYIYFVITLIISCFSFIFLNSKGKIFLGDSGSYCISFLLALILISLYETKSLPAEQIVIFMFLPIVDSIRLFFVRILNRKNPFYPDSNHLHLILLKRIGFQKTLMILSVFLFLPIFSIKLSFLEPFVFLLISTIFYLIILKRFSTKNLNE